MFTPKGLEVKVRVLRISLRRSSGVGWVRAVSWEMLVAVLSQGTGGNVRFLDRQRY